MSRTGAEIYASESEAKSILDRINAVERYFGSLCETFSSYTRKTARLRDKGDEICSSLMGYIGSQMYNSSTKAGMTEFASHLSAIQDYRQAEVQRLDNKVVHPLSAYGLICKQEKVELKLHTGKIEKERASKKKMDKNRLKVNTSHHSLTLGEAELSKISNEATRATKEMEKRTENFEGKKLQDIRKIMMDFIQVEMAFHAKALEIYSQCYKHVSNIETDDDLEEYKKYMKHSDTEARTNLAKTASQSSLSSVDSANSGSFKGSIRPPPVKSTSGSIRPPSKETTPVAARRPPAPTPSVTSSTPSTPTKKPAPNHVESPTYATPTKKTVSGGNPRQVISVGKIESDEEDEDDDDDEYETGSDEDDYTTQTETERTERSDRRVPASKTATAWR